MARRARGIARSLCRLAQVALGVIVDRLRQPPCGEVVELDDSQDLWRRVRDHADHLTWNSDDRRWMPRPTPPSNALQFDPDMSTSWSQHLQGRHNQGPDAALDYEGRYTLVYGLNVGEARLIGCTVRHSPQASDPPDCAHSSLEWPVPADKSTRKAIRADLSHAMKLVHGESRLEPPPGS